MLDFTPSFNRKKFFRLTGPPENWLTAIKFMTWGIEEKHRNKWKEIQTGDIFFIHSTGASSSLFKNAKSGIIGLGVYLRYVRVLSLLSCKTPPLFYNNYSVNRSCTKHFYIYNGRGSYLPILR